MSRHRAARRVAEDETPGGMAARFMHSGVAWAPWRVDRLLSPWLIDPRTWGGVLIVVGFAMLLWPVVTGQVFALPAVVSGIGVLAMLSGIAILVIAQARRD
jgi:hypothetical protein